MNSKFAISNVCSCFEQKAIGTKVLYKEVFLNSLAEALLNHDATKDDVKGQHLVAMPKDAFSAVSAGVGKRANTVPGDYIVRLYRGHCNAYLKRHLAEKVKSLSVVVYTKSAYLSDPDVVVVRDDVVDMAEYNRIAASEASHVIVAVLAFATNGEPPYSPCRLVSNLAGGNLAAAMWSTDTIFRKAKECIAYYDEWCVVAD